MPCPHQTRSYTCLQCFDEQCGGRGICQHRRRRNRCTQCQAVGEQVRELCAHGLQRHQCSQCLGVRALQKTSFCSACGDKRLSKARRTPGGLCSKCAGDEPRAEQTMMDAILRLVDHRPSGIDNLTLGGPACATAHRRPDACWLGPDHAVILELDELSHRHRQPSCELSKVCDQAFALKTLFKRESYRVDTLRCGSLDAMHAPIVAQVVNEWLRDPDTNGSKLKPNLGFILYSAHGNKHISHALKNTNSIGILFP